MTDARNPSNETPRSESTMAICPDCGEQSVLPVRVRYNPIVELDPNRRFTSCALRCTEDGCGWTTGRGGSDE